MEMAVRQAGLWSLEVSYLTLASDADIHGLLPWRQEELALLGRDFPPERHLVGRTPKPNMLCAKGVPNCVDH
jgi:hypothetical protein